MLPVRGPGRPVRWLAAGVIAARGMRPAAVRSLWVVPLRARLARWQVPTPGSVMLALRQLRERTGFAFDHVLCLRTSLGRDLASFVLLEARTSTLVVSEQLVRQLTPSQLVALLAHEARHVVVDRVNPKWGAGAVAGLTFVGGIIAERLVSRGVTTSLGVLCFAAVIIAIHGIRYPLHRWMDDARQAEFDDFALDRSGALSMLGRLDHLGANTPPAADIQHRWTGVGQSDRQSSRLFRASE